MIFYTFFFLEKSFKIFKSQIIFFDDSLLLMILLMIPYYIEFISVFKRKANFIIEQ